MKGWLKKADAPPSATGMSAASPIPTPSIAPTFAAGLKGPTGISPRTNYARVNTGTPPQPDAGSESQKSMPPRGAEMLPKRASADGDRTMGQMASRPMLQDLVKAAMTDASQRASVNAEAHLQSTKTAEDKKCEKCGKEKCACMGKTASAFQVDLGEKLAGALDFMAGELLKNAEGSLGGPYNLKEHLVGSPPGVSQATASTSLPDHKGQATPAHVTPMSPPLQKDLPAEHGATQMKDNIAEGLEHQKMPPNIVSSGKHASVADMVTAKLAATKIASEAEKKETEGLAAAKAGIEHAEAAHKSEPENKKEGAAAPTSLVDYMAAKIAAETKVAEDAINPARISAGAAVPPATSQAGQPGGTPVGGAPKGPSSLVGSNDSARHYQRSAAYAPRKAELGKYLKEPALSMEHDSVLRDAFKHTAQAGTKFASADPPEPAVDPAIEAVKVAAAAAAPPAAPATTTPSPVVESTKLAAGKVLLSRLAADIDAAAAGGQ
jgi:hypothetical protein